MKFVTKEYANDKTILALAHDPITVPVMIDSTDASVVTDSTTGRKVMPAGTIIGGGFLTTASTKATTQNDADAEAVLYNDVDVTNGDAPGAGIIWGFVSLSKLSVAPATEAKTALKGIHFLL